MAKRKRAISEHSTTDTPEKRQKDHPHGEVDYEREYRLKAIIAERHNRYLIDWEPEVDGTAYEPTWEPKKNVNQLAKDDWNRKKALEKTPKKKRGRGKRPIIESSPVPEEASASTTEGPDSSFVATEPEVVIQESQQTIAGAEQDADSPLFVTDKASVTSEQRPETVRKASVQLPDPPSSWRDGAYQIFDSSSEKSIPESLQYETVSTPATQEPEPATQGLDAQVQEPEAQTQEQSAGTSSASQVVPDSQDQEHSESSSFQGFSPVPELGEPSLDEQVAVSESADKEPNQPSLVSQPSRVPAPAESPRTDSVEPSQESVSNQTDDSQQKRAEKHQSNLAEVIIEAPTNQLESNRLETSEPPSETQSGQEGCASQRGTQHQQDPAAEAAQQVVVIESSSSLESIGKLLTQPDYQPPPAAQKPPPSSALHGDGEHRPNDERQGADNSASQPPQVASLSSTPFLTQLGDHIRPTIEDVKASSRSPFTGRALFRPHLNGTQSASPFSSEFPSLPSYSLPTIGDSAPATFQFTNSRPTTPVRISMESSSMPTPKSDLQARLKAMRDSKNARRSQTPAILGKQPASSLPPNITAEVAAARASPIPNYLQDGTRSPSAVPAMEHEPPATKEEMNTSERYGTLLPQTQASNSDFEGRSHNGPLTSAGTPKTPREPNEDPEIANVHVIPVSLANHQGDQYRSHIYHYKDTINQFLQDRHPSQELLADAERVVECLREIAMHPDLVNFETLSQMSSPGRQKQWDIDCSGKFRFLDEFLMQMSDQKPHIAVIARGNRVPDMLETFLKGSRIAYTRGRSSHAEQTGLRVSLIDLDNTAERDVANADIVIVMDGNIDARHPIIRKARRHDTIEGMTQTNSWAMLLTLVAPQTIEHIERCMTTNLSATVRVRVLLNATLKMRHDAGRPEDGQSSPKEAAATLADFLDDPDDTKWPLGELSQIEDLDSQTETDLDQSSNDLLANTGDKRPFDATGTTSPEALMKRPRLEEASQIPATINPQDIEVTHISDSVEKGTQSNLVEMTDVFTGPSETERHLREVLEGVQDRLEQHVQALEDLQYRHEAQRGELVTRTRERDDLITRMQQQVERMTLAEGRNTDIKAERTLLKDQLEEANRKLLDHIVPERREFETLRLATERAQQAQQKAEKRAETAQKDLDFTREMYQDSSNRARELAEQSADFESRLKQAEILASGEQARVKQLSQDTRNKALERENSKLKSMLKEREAGLTFKDEEISRLKEAGRGRMGTRQSSVPRSPRLGSPIKGRASRQSSPSAGELPRGRGAHLHPLRHG